MHNVLIGLTYIAMLLSPCVVAQWGHLLSFKMAMRIFMTRAERAVARLEDERLDLEFQRAGYAETFRVTIPPLLFDMNSTLEATRARQRAAASGSASFAEAQRRVAARLAQITQSERDGVVVEKPLNLPLVEVAPEVPRREIALAEKAREVPKAMPDRNPFYSHTFETTGMGMAWNSTAEYPSPSFHPPRLLEPAATESDAETSEQEHRTRDLSKAA